MQIKIYISFLITALFLCVPHTRAQEIEVPITLNEHGTQLRDVLRKIEQQSPYLFLYNETQLDMKQKINEKINHKKKSVFINKKNKNLFGTS